eukprot:TRINITY_DN121416_c0_g1_i1.p1 TRINITY_DN121416_c0_g1~~TRINITY_DN121416_c0_g1_i1.p1  ORF type:complete len:185 (+),score=0.41 TRINITY_DN121416_c0_g1_i1:249-803(+)
MKGIIAVVLLTLLLAFTVAKRKVKTSSKKGTCDCNEFIEYRRSIAKELLSNEDYFETFAGGYYSKLYHLGGYGLTRNVAHAMLTGMQLTGLAFPDLGSSYERGIIWEHNQDGDLFWSEDEFKSFIRDMLKELARDPSQQYLRLNTSQFQIESFKAHSLGFIRSYNKAAHNRGFWGLVSNTPTFI